jgi:hypothetical protein
VRESFPHRQTVCSNNVGSDDTTAQQPTPQKREERKGLIKRMRKKKKRKRKRKKKRKRKRKRVI